MGPSSSLVLLLAILSAVLFQWGEGFTPYSSKYGESEAIFLLYKSKQILKTEAGEVRVARGEEGITRRGNMEIGFVSMEPKSLFLPQYLDADLIFYIQRGSAKLGWVHNNDLVEKNLEIGDVYRVPGGSVFYLVNTDKGERLEIFYSIDTSHSFNHGSFQSFFVGGGLDPTTIFSAFDDQTLSKAFNVSRSELDSFIGRQRGGPIIYITDKQVKSIKSSISSGYGSWDWRHFVESFNKARRGRLDAYNIFKKDKDFRNDYGWSLAVDSNDYGPLDEPDIGIFYVKLSAGSMMAPHLNPRATEYGIITRGEGRIQIAFPNGTSAMDIKVGVGDVFWVPQYYPVCQTASRNGPMEFFGFSTSARGNRPQFLAGKNSVLNIMEGRNLATAFNVSEKRLREMLRAQKEAVILPSLPLLPPDGREQSFFSILGFT